MGGRLDATNLVSPLVTVITNISRDHEDFLGKGIMNIAGEKAGIIKPGVPLVTGVTQNKVRELFSRICAENKSPLYLLGREARVRRVPNGTFSFKGSQLSLNHLVSGLMGPHQIQNSGLALMAVERLKELGYKIPKEAIYQGLRRVNWPGRFQVISASPALVLDGAHNPAAARILAKALGREFPGRRFRLILGIMKDKEVKEILKPLLTLSDDLYVTCPQYYRAARPEELVMAVAAMGKKARPFPSIGQALEAALKEAAPKEVLVVTGSLFTVGEALDYWQGHKKFTLS
jgi:dihydrofolate synthase/folylpolyglutamate synthase